MGRGYFNNPANERPNWIRAYVAAVKRVGKNTANRQFPQVLNWVSTQKMLGRNPNVFYNSNSTRSGRSSRRKPRKTRKN
jgi:hypothetical protein